MIKRYKNNLIVVDNKVISYESHVASIVGTKLILNPIFIKFSCTTTKHINLIAKEMGLSIEVGGKEF